MKHVVRAAYKDALHSLRKDMIHRMVGNKGMSENEEEEESPAEEASESPAEEAQEEAAGEHLGTPGKSAEVEHDMGLTDEEKRDAMYGKKGKPKPGGMMVVIGVGKGKPGKKR